MSDVSDLSSSKLDDNQTITIDKERVKGYLGVLALVIFFGCLFSYIAYDMTTSSNLRKEQRISFIEKMESQGWTYNCVGGGKMVFTKDDDESIPFVVKECCRGLR